MRHSGCDIWLLPRKRDSQKNWAKIRDWERERYSGRAMTDVWSTGFSVGSGSPFPDPISKDHPRSHAWGFLDTGLGNSAILGSASCRECKDGSWGRGILHGMRVFLSRPYFKRSYSFSSLKITTLGILQDNRSGSHSEISPIHYFICSNFNVFIWKGGLGRFFLNPINRD